MAWDDYYDPTPPPPKRILFAVRDQTVAAQLRVDLGLAHMTTIAPDLECYEKDFDVIVLCFEPTTARELVWYHNTLVPLINVNGVIRLGTY